MLCIFESFVLQQLCWRGCSVMRLYRPLIIFIYVAIVVKSSSFFANSASVAAQMSHLHSSSAPQIDITIPGAGYERAFVTDKITDGGKCNVFVKETDKPKASAITIQLRTSAGDKTTTKRTNLEEMKYHAETTFAYMLENDTLPRAVKRFISAQQLISTPR